MTKRSILPTWENIYTISSTFLGPKLCTERFFKHGTCSKIGTTCQLLTILLQSFLVSRGLTSSRSSYIIMQHYLLLSRNLLYTGLTRAKQLAVLVGPTKALGLAIKRVTDRQRYTALANRMKSLTVSPTWIK